MRDLGSHRIRPARLLMTLLEALAISWALLYFGEYFGWHSVREAGGLSAQMSNASPRDSRVSYRP